MKIATYAQALRDCVCEMLAQRGQGPVCRCVIDLGVEAAWESCEDCSECGGTAWVMIGPANPYQTFPIPEAAAECARPVMWTVTVGVARCWPVGDEDPPTPQEIEEASLRLLSDAFALHCAIQTCKSGADVAVLGWEVLGPVGACNGGEWTIYVDPVR